MLGILFKQTVTAKLSQHLFDLGLQVEEFEALEGWKILSLNSVLLSFGYLLFHFGRLGVLLKMCWSHRS